MTVENLMEVKKHRLLLMIQQPPTAPPTSGGDTQPVRRETLSGPHPSSGEEGLEGVISSDTAPNEEMVGKKCRAPLEEVSIL